MADQRPKVLLATSAVGVGGAEQYLIELATALIDAGYIIALAAGDTVATKLVSMIDRPAVRVLAGGIEWEWGSEGTNGDAQYNMKVEQQRMAFLSLLSQFTCDFAFINVHWPTNYAGILKALCDAGTPFGLHFHLCPHTIWLSSSAQEIHAATLPRASFLTAVSINTRFFAEQTFGRFLGFEVVVNGSRFNRASVDDEGLISRPRPPTLICASRLEMQKGIVDLLPAINFPGALGRYRLVILGQGRLSHVLNGLIFSGNRSVTFEGQVTDVQDRMEVADGFVLASHFEGMSLSLLEAISCACIPIITDASSAKEIITDGEDGFLFRVGDWRSFLWALHQFDRSDKVAMRRNCLQRSKYFGRARMLGTMINKIQENVSAVGVQPSTGKALTNPAAGADMG